jgi:hypothetical protein
VNIPDDLRPDLRWRVSRELEGMMLDWRQHAHFVEVLTKWARGLQRAEAERDAARGRRRRRKDAEA